MRKNIFLILLLATIFVFVGTINNTKAADDPVEFIKNAKTPVYLHSLAPGDNLVHNLPSQVGDSTWHSLYPHQVYCHYWDVIDQYDNGIPGLNPSDWLKLRHHTMGNSVWVHVEEVTLTLKLARTIPPFDTMYVEYTGGYDSLEYPIMNPVSTWWHEIWPVYCPYFHLDAIDPGPPLQTCRNITLGGIVWHVEDVAIDILVLSGPVPRTPTMTQWGVIVLVALIVGSAVFIMLRRRRATVPA
jgi:hypothetical protein